MFSRAAKEIFNWKDIFQVNWLKFLIFFCPWIYVMVKTSKYFLKSLGSILTVRLALISAGSFSSIFILRAFTYLKQTQWTSITQYQCKKDILQWKSFWFSWNQHVFCWNRHDTLVFCWNQHAVSVYLTGLP